MPSYCCIAIVLLSRDGELDFLLPYHSFLLIKSCFPLCTGTVCHQIKIHILCSSLQQINSVTYAINVNYRHDPILTYQLSILLFYGQVALLARLGQGSRGFNQGHIRGAS